MRRNAVMLSVIFAFAITLTLVTYTFWNFYKLNKEQYIDNIFTKYSVITQIYREHMMKRAPKVALEANLAVYDLHPIEDEIGINEVFEKAKVLKKVGFSEVTHSMLFMPKRIIASKDVQGLRATMLESDRQIYFFIESKRSKVLLNDSSLKPYFPVHLLSAYLTIIFVIIISIIIILVKLQPLRVLTKKLNLYASGDRSVSFASNGSDEIAVLANELERARTNINALIESRTMFLRNIMHELKTPIAKGRISTEMLKDIKQKERLSRVFIRLEQLINEFALIEEVTSGAGHTDMKKYRLVDIIDEAIDQSMVEPFYIDTQVENNVQLICDFKLMSTAFKNMIDNGIKYSDDSRVTIKASGAELLFLSRGDKLSKPLSYYVQPFSKEIPSKDSFGLGLYLVDAIVKIHKMRLSYLYQNGKNIFIVHMHKC